MNSILVDDAPLVANSIVVREITSLGIRGADIPTATFPYASYLLATADLPEDNEKEFRGEMLSHNFPPATFEYYDDGSIAVLEGCPPGVYTYTFRLWVDGQPMSPLVTNTVYVGSSGTLSTNTALSVLVPDVTIESLGPAVIGFDSALEPLQAVVSLSTTTTLGFNATMNGLGTNLFFYGNLVGTLPPTLNRQRQIRVLKDENMNAYSSVRQFRWQFEKDPQARLDYSLDWSDWLEDDRIADLYVHKSDGLVVDAQGVVGEGRITAVMVTGGVVGASEYITFRARTRDGREDERTLTLILRNK